MPTHLGVPDFSVGRWGSRHSLTSLRASMRTRVDTAGRRRGDVPQVCSRLSPFPCSPLAPWCLRASAAARRQHAPSAPDTKKVLR